MFEYCTRSPQQVSNIVPDKVKQDAMHWDIKIYCVTAGLKMFLVCSNALFSHDTIPKMTLSHSQSIATRYSSTLAERSLAAGSAVASGTSTPAILRAALATTETKAGESLGATASGISRLDLGR